MALLIGLLPLVFLFNWGGVLTSDPPICLGMLGYHVPCGGWPALAAGALMAGVVWVVLWLGSRRS